jgi:hypothetical protein
LEDRESIIILILIYMFGIRLGSDGPTLAQSRVRKVFREVEERLGRKVRPEQLGFKVRQVFKEREDHKA